MVLRSGIGRVCEGVVIGIPAIWIVSAHTEILAVKKGLQQSANESLMRADGARNPRGAQRIHKELRGEIAGLKAL